jgi:hypothetical protein
MSISSIQNIQEYGGNDNHDAEKNEGGYEKDVLAITPTSANGLFL